MAGSDPGLLPYTTGPPWKIVERFAFSWGLQLANDILASSNPSGKREAQNFAMFVTWMLDFLFCQEVWQLLRNSVAEWQWLIIRTEALNSENQFWAWCWNHHCTDFWFFFFTCTVSGFSFFVAAGGVSCGCPGSSWWAVGVEDESRDEWDARCSLPLS